MTERSPASDQDLQELVAQSDTGGRQPRGVALGVILGAALLWSLFQLYYASPLPFALNLFVLNDTEARAIHLAFGIFLAYLSYPAYSGAPRDRIPIYDWVLAIVGALCAAYLYIFYDGLSSRPGLPTQLDIVVAIVGVLVLLEATRRSLGPALVIVAVVFLCYVFLGPYAPDVIAHRGASLTKAATHFWLYTEGVFGVALGVSASFVFLFVLFGALLDKAGAGNYFIKVAFSLLGHLRGGPAKAAVLSSGLTGLISGSSIANVVTTGTFTVPLMKRVGFSSEKAGAVEVASSVNGQIMPPVMGAAAFLMVEFIGIPYDQVVRHAFLPAVISYIALIYIVHLEALKAGMQGLPRPTVSTWAQSLFSGLFTFFGIIILAGAVYWGIGWLKDVFPERALTFIMIAIAAAYVSLLFLATRVPELEEDDPNAPVESLPEVRPTVLAGLHFLLPVIVLIWCLMIELLSPGLSAFYATVVLIVILLTQRPLAMLFRAQPGRLPAAFVAGLNDLYHGLVAGARNMVGIAIATATAGIIVGTVSLTPLSQQMTELVELLSGGNLLLMLILVAISSLILGMGLPTTANYIVVSSLMAPVVVELGAASGLIVPLIAVHLFVFYFGIMADVTPPVGLASFAAAAVSGGDPIRTGFTAFFYSLRTAALPFLFIFNTQLLLIDTGWIDGILTVVTATIAMLVFAAATMGYFFTKNRFYETALLLLVAFSLFRPGFWMDQIIPPFADHAPGDLYSVAEAQPEGGAMRIEVQGPDFMNMEQTNNKTLRLDLSEPGTGQERVDRLGLTFQRGEDGMMALEEPFPGTPYFEEFSNFDFYGDQPVRVTAVNVAAERPAKEWIFLPALLLLAGIVWLQRRRMREGAPLAGEAQPVSAE